MRSGECGNEVRGEFGKGLMSVTDSSVTNRSPWSACSQMPPCLAGRGSIWAVACGSLDNWWSADNTTVKIWLCSKFHTQNHSLKGMLNFISLLLP